MFKNVNLEDYVDAGFVKTIFATRELTMNFGTRRKQIYCAAYLFVIMIIILLAVRRTEEIGDGLESYIRYTLLALAVILYGTEPFVLILQTIVFQHPAVDLNSLGKEDTSQIALVISCHKSADVIVRTCEAAMKHLRPEQIFVMDNATFLDPPDNTREVLAEADLHEVNYIYNPFGNKTLAMFAGAVAAKDFKYLCLIDDDVTIPEDMNFGVHLMREKVKAICYPIRAVHPDDGTDKSWFIQWQGIEYKMADYAKMIQNQWSTVLYPHGACALWDRSVLIECFREHDTVFFADDVKMGLWFSRHGYEMRIHYHVMVDTDAPASLIGPMPNYYNQRVRSWDMAEHAYAYEHIRVLFFTRHTTLLGTIVMKWYQFYALYSIVADQMRLPVMILTSIISWKFFVMITGFFLLGYTLFVIVWDWWGYMRCPERKSKLLALVTFQIYKVPAILIRLIGMGRAYFVYLPNYKAKPTIPMLEREYKNAARAASGTRKCPVWIDKSHQVFGSYYQHYDPRHPTEVHEDMEGPAEEPIPMPRPIASALASVGSDGSGGTSITSITMEPYEPTAERNQQFRPRLPPPTQSQPPIPVTEDEKSDSLSLSSEQKSSSSVSHSWLTGIPEGQNEGSSGMRSRSRSSKAASISSSQGSAIESLSQDDDKIPYASGQSSGSDIIPKKISRSSKTNSTSGARSSQKLDSLAKKASLRVSSSKSLDSVDISIKSLKSAKSFKSSDSSGCFSEALAEDNEVPTTQ